VLAALPPPRVLALDCEFKPLRCAAVDENGLIRLNHLVEPAVKPAGTSQPPTPGLLSCDRDLFARIDLPDLQAQLLQWSSDGCVFIGHTLANDLRALELDGKLAYEDISHLHMDDEAERKAAAARGVGAMSLRRLAAKYLNLEMQRGGSKHCAVQDSEVTMRLFQLLGKSE